MANRIKDCGRLDDLTRFATDCQRAETLGDLHGTIDAAVRELVETAFLRAVSILSTNRDLLGRAAQNLLNQETLSSEDLETIDRSVARDAGGWTAAPPGVGLAAATAVERG